MAICPHCQAEGPKEYEPCPTGDGYFLVSERDYHSHTGDSWLGRMIGGRFVIASVLGQGAMGEVYKAYQEQVDRMVAIKLFDIRKVDGKGRSSRERFVQEARVLAKLSHPNCVTLYDFGFDEERNFLYIAMEYVGGISLRRAVRRGLKVDAVIEIVRQVLLALREAHGLNIVHRDLKPENIMLSYRRTSDEQIVKVLDFGIAKLLHGEQVARTMAGLLFGTPAYMSPEQCRGETDVTPATDIYALGCMAFEMLTGHLPFAAEFPQEMVRLHQEAPVPELRPRIRQKLPPGLEGFVYQCMAKAPEDRFDNAAKALAAFEMVVGDARDVTLTGLMRRDESFNRQVSVPDHRVSGAKLDPIGGQVEGEPTQKGSTKVRTTAEAARMTSSKERLIDTLSGRAEEQAMMNPHRRLQRQVGGKALAMAAILVVITLLVLVVTVIALSI